MLTKRYPFESDGPDRLDISWGVTRWTPCTVTLDGAVLATFEKTELVEGVPLRLPDGASLNIQFADLFGRQLEVLRNGVPLPGSEPVRAPATLVYAGFFGVTWAVFALALLVSILSSNAQIAFFALGAAVLAVGCAIGASVWLAVSGLWTRQAFKGILQPHEGWLGIARIVGVVFLSFGALAELLFFLLDGDGNHLFTVGMFVFLLIVLLRRRSPGGSRSPASLPPQRWPHEPVSAPVEPAERSNDVGNTDP